MSNVRTIYLDWNGGVIKSEGGSQLARQYDHLSNLVIFKNAPNLENYYLIVKMKATEDDFVPHEMEPIQLAGPHWLIPNSYTQLVQPVIFQVCCKTETGDFEHHSAKYTLNVIESLGHNGSELEVDPSPMFDAYEDYVDEKVQELIDEAGGISIDTRAYVDQKITEMVAAAGEVIIDSTLSISGAAADAKATGDALSETNERLDAIEQGGAGGLTDGAKQALLACLQNVAWIDDNGQTYYDALVNALYPPANLLSISAVYTQSGTVYDTDSLNSLKPDLVVTALYDDQSTEVVTDYVLSGTLSAGTSTVSVVYGDKTASFTVSVTEKPKAWYTGVALNLGTVEAGTINATTGEDIESTTRNRTDYIDIEGVHLLSSRKASNKQSTGNNAIFYFYDEDHDFISSKSFGSANNKITISTIPEGTKFVRFTAPIDNMGGEATTPYEFMPWAKPKEQCFNGTYSIAKEDSTNGNMNTTTGQPDSGSQYCSPYIPIYGFETLSFAKNGTAQTYLYVTLYDVDKNYIGAWSASAVDAFNSTNYPFREVAYIRWYVLGVPDFPAEITNTATVEG